LILDTSAILAILFREPEHVEFLRKMGAVATVGVGAPTLVETTIVATARLGGQAPQMLSAMVERAGMVVVSFDPPHARLAIEAWLRFGRGRHPAGLNLGDCLSYATARLAGRPLLCKGGDFSKTDLVLA
jgi:ribonuclease VapC